MTEELRDKVWELVWYFKHGTFDAINAPAKQKLKVLFEELLGTQIGALSNVPTFSVPASEVPTPSTPTFLFPKEDKGKKSLWIPFARRLTQGRAQGTYPGNYPKGAIVHWTAGHRNGLDRGNSLMRDTKMLYLIIDAEGNLGQSNPLSEHGYHAGQSGWPGLQGTVSDELIGIELQAAGSLEIHNGNFYPWWDEGAHNPKNIIDPETVSYVHANRDNLTKGYYQKYTPQQFSTLIKTILWLEYNCPTLFSLDLVLGHDEVSPRRKNDPSGALVDEEGKILTMPEFRIRLKKEYEKI